MMAQMSGEDSDSVGMDTTSFIMDLPLLSVLHFQENALSSPPDEMVEQMLMQVHGAGAQTNDAFYEKV